MLPWVCVWMRELRTGMRPVFILWLCLLWLAVALVAVALPGQCHPSLGEVKESYPVEDDGV